MAGATRRRLVAAVLFSVGLLAGILAFASGPALLAADTCFNEDDLVCSTTEACRLLDTRSHCITTYEYYPKKSNRRQKDLVKRY